MEKKFSYLNFEEENIVINFDGIFKIIIISLWSHAHAIQHIIDTSFSPVSISKVLHQGLIIRQFSLHFSRTQGLHFHQQITSKLFAS